MSREDVDWFEELWEHREEELYPALFGPLRGIFPIPWELLNRLAEGVDPRWTTVGVFESAPISARNSWLYVTSGLSNPWDQEPEAFDPEEYSGFGLELLLETDAQATWPIFILHWLSALHILSSCRRIPGEPFSLDARVALKAPIDGQDSALRNVLLTRPASIAPTLRQRSGVAEWMLCVGITDQEKAFGREHGSDALLQKLEAAGAFPITVAARGTVPLG